MMARSGGIIGLLLLFALLVGVFVAVLEKRFSSGEIYPHYSTLRSDPLGSRALFESLSELPEWELSRNQRPLMAIDSLDSDSALWLVGLSRQSFSQMRAPEESPVLKAVEESGAHLVITLNPKLVPREFDLEPEADEEWWERREDLRRKEEGEASENETDAPVSSSQEDEVEEDAIGVGTRLSDWLEIRLMVPENLERPEDGWALSPVSAAETKGDPLPEAWPIWRSQLRFSELGEAWEVVAAIEEDPVVITRKLGKGSVTLTSDSYFASNEALWKNPNASFLIWLGGGRTHHVFDETIHGRVESGGVMKMIRRYQLHGFFYGLAIFIGLLAWRSASSLAPGSEIIERGLTGNEDSENSAVTGEETSSGFLRLLRLNVPPKRLLRTCVETWRKTGGTGLRIRTESEGQREAIEAVITAHEARPREISSTHAFHQITRILSQPDHYREQDQP